MSRFLRDMLMAADLLRTFKGNRPPDTSPSRERDDDDAPPQTPEEPQQVAGRQSPR